MSAEENKAIAQRYWDEIWSAGNVAMVDEFVAPDSLFHAGETIDSRDNEVRQQSTIRWRTSVPDLRATIEDIFAEGDKVVVRWILRGTRRGNLALGPLEITVPPTGKQIAIFGMDTIISGAARSSKPGAAGTDYLCTSSSGLCRQRDRCTRPSV